MAFLHNFCKRKKKKRIWTAVLSPCPLVWVRDLVRAGGRRLEKFVAICSAVGCVCHKMQLSLSLCLLPGRAIKAILKVTLQLNYVQKERGERGGSSCLEPWLKMTDSIVVEGQVRLRDGKKVSEMGIFSTVAFDFQETLLSWNFNWSFIRFPYSFPVVLWFQWKNRWVLLRKPSPVAGTVLILSSLFVLLYITNQ